MTDMTREEFEPICRRLITAYQKDGFLKTKDAVDLWMRYLGDLDAKLVSDAVDKHILSSSYPPTIADIRRSCDEELEKISRLKAEMREIFEMSISGYPGTNKMQGNTMVWWNYLTAADTWEERVEKAKRLESYISEYVRECELDGTINEIMTFTEYLDSLYELERQSELYS